MAEGGTEPQPADYAERAAREREHWDHGNWVERGDGTAFWYVRRSPNSLRNVVAWQSLVKESCRGVRAMDLGCGTGGDCRRLHEWGAAEVHGLEVSPGSLEVARRYEGPTVKFFVHDLHEAWPQRYDLIIGRSVLHHLDYQKVMKRLYRDNLSPGGRMIFIEPLGEGLLMKAYWRFGTRYHTPDERPFKRADIEWLRREFPGFALFPNNYSSLPASIVSWALRLKPNNALTRAADRFDTYVANHVETLALHFRSAIFSIPKPRGGNEG